MKSTYRRTAMEQVRHEVNTALAILDGVEETAAEMGWSEAQATTELRNRLQICRPAGSLEIVI